MNRIIKYAKYINKHGELIDELRVCTDETAAGEKRIRSEIYD